MGREQAGRQLSAHSVRRQREIVISWDAIGAMGEWAGAIAVVVTLVYLARQIQQANQIGNAEAEREFWIFWNEIMKGLAGDLESAELIQRGLARYSDLSQPERAVFFTKIGAIFNAADLSLLLSEKGMLGEDVSGVIMDLGVGVILTEGGGEWWEAMGPIFHVYDRMQTWRDRTDRTFTPLDFWRLRRDA